MHNDNRTSLATLARPVIVGAALPANRDVLAKALDAVYQQVRNIPLPSASTMAKKRHKPAPTLGDIHY